MKYLLLSLTIILTTSVMAQASEPKWVTNYSTETEVDGLPVRANLDVAENLNNNPIASFESGVADHSLLPVVKREYRLNLIVSEHPRVEMTYKVQPRTISVNGQPKFAYVSDLGSDQKIHFLITTRENGLLDVDYSQKADNGNLSVGSFSLLPVPHVF